MKVIFFISRLFWQEEVFALLQFAHDCDFCQKLAAPRAFQCQQKNWSDSLAACEVRHAWEPLDLLFQMFSWSPPLRYFLDLTLSDISFLYLPDILFNKPESDVRRIQLCQLLENSIFPPAALSQDINTSDINSRVSLALGWALKKWIQPISFL